MRDEDTDPSSPSSQERTHDLCPRKANSEDKPLGVKSTDFLYYWMG